MNTAAIDGMSISGSNRLNPMAQAYGHERPASAHAAQDPDFSAPANGVSRKRAVVPVGMLMRPFAAITDGIGAVISMIWRAILRLLRRIAGRHDVELDAPREIAAGNMGESASFVGENAGAAAKDASEEIRGASDLAAQVAHDTPFFRQALQGEGSAAYLKLALDRLGSDLNSALALRQTQRGQLLAAISPVALRMGVADDELIALLARDTLDEATLGMDVALPALRELALQAQATDARIESLRAQFVDYCAAALESSTQEPDERLQGIVQGSVRDLNDSVLNEAVERVIAQSRQAREQIATVDATTVAVAQETQPKAMQIQGDADPSAPETARRRRFGSIDVGQTQAPAPVDGAGAASSGLPPVPLADFAPLDINLGDEAPDQTKPWRQRAA